MNILLNGEPYQAAPGSPLSEILEQLDLEGKIFAVELNEEIVPKGRFDQTRLADGDRLEIVQAIGGG